MVKPRILIIDCETSPNLADVWGIWQQNIGLSQIRSVTSVISFAAKWHEEKPIMFHSDFHDGHKQMVKAAHRLIDEADILVTYNGDNFDAKQFNREFILAGLTPPSPVRSVDLLKTVRRQFKFTSNKLDHVASQLGLGNKTSHSGHELWVRCLEGDEKAWNLMRRYNKQDVALTEKLYDKLGPWIKDHPSQSLFTCPRCGSSRVQRRGIATTLTAVYQRYQCRDCGSWSKGKKQISTTELRGIK
jgi:predicted RNA-binding Zn-ribbon protein involved in translation (DUF1610 family)